MTLGLTVIAILLLLGLLCCVVLVLFLRRGFSGRTFGGTYVVLEFAHPRFHLIDQPDILVIPHYAGLRIVVRVPYGCGTQADLAQVGGFHAEYAQGHREREERHAERHGEPRLPHRGPDRLNEARSPVLRPLQPRDPRRSRSE